MSQQNLVKIFVQTLIARNKLKVSVMGSNLAIRVMASAVRSLAFGSISGTRFRIEVWKKIREMEKDKHNLLRLP
ncbi:MAG: hypothetical protein ACHQ1D_06795 [Nitrososphaerales archaeon]